KRCRVTPLSRRSLRTAPGGSARVKATTVTSAPIRARVSAVRAPLRASPPMSGGKRSARRQRRMSATAEGDLGRDHHPLGLGDVVEEEDRPRRAAIALARELLAVVGGLHLDALLVGVELHLADVGLVALDLEAVVFRLDRVGVRVLLVVADLDL